MPQVVYPTQNPDTEEDRTWDDVFPELKDHTGDWDIVNGILFQIALGARFGSDSPNAVYESLKVAAYDQVQDNLNRSGLNEESRTADFAHYGKTLFYMARVFANLGGSYREHKS